MNITKIFSLILLILLTGILLGSELQAQEQETVYFIDGTSVSGKIIELNTIKVRIKQDDGSIIERSFKEIQMVSSARSFSNSYDRTKGQSDSFGVKKAGRISKHSFKVAPVAYNFEYNESSMTEEGMMYGINGSYEYNDNDKALMINLSLEYLSGDLDYDGMTWGGSPVTADTQDYIWEGRFLIGGDAYDGRYKVTPFVGLGMRYWNDVIKGSDGYEREVIYYYSPIGFSIYKSLSNKWSWLFNAEYDLFWGGEVTSHLSDADPGFNDPKNGQKFGNGHGMRISLKFSNQFNKKLSWFIEPFFRYWDVGESGCSTLFFNDVPVATVYEPANDTKTFGLYLGLGF